ncbi:MAG: hypothetical protein FD181_173 [Prolixibacteraceae bacterium]|nr:MAG: hypothetical protein FD181_173 [Prolixibacteraceae bacterium]
MKTNTSISNLLVLASISSSVLPLQYESDYILQNNASYIYCQDIADWSASILQNPLNYVASNYNIEKFKTLLVFTKTLIENSTEIEVEIVDLVNENFWDLI